MTATYKNAADHTIAIMKEMADAPMSDTVARMVAEILVRGKPMTVEKARHYYRSAASDGRAPGNVPLPQKAQPKAEKPAKAPKAPKTPKAPADRIEVLKAAARKAGVHLDSIPGKESVEAAAETFDNDPLNLAAPEALSLEDLKNEI